jgi:hypothetical protein
LISTVRPRGRIALTPGETRAARGPQARARAVIRSRSMDEVSEILLCEVENEVEAALVVNLLNEDGIPARSDSAPGSTIFGGLPFEPGHKIYVPSSLAKVAHDILAKHPHYKKLKNVHDPES